MRVWTKPGEQIFRQIYETKIFRSLPYIIAVRVAVQSHVNVEEQSRENLVGKTADENKFREYYLWSIMRIWKDNFWLYMLKYNFTAFGGIAAKVIWMTVLLLADLG